MPIKWKINITFSVYRCTRVSVLGENSLFSYLWHCQMKGISNWKASIYNGATPNFCSRYKIFLSLLSIIIGYLRLWIKSCANPVKTIIFVLKLGCYNKTNYQTRILTYLMSFTYKKNLKWNKIVRIKRFCYNHISSDNL